MCDIKTGVELELWVVDDNGRLADGSEIVAAHEQIKPEFIDPLVEVQTEPHEDEFGLRRDLETTLRTGVRVAEKHDKQLVPLGTPLTSSNTQANCKRGELFEEIYGDGVQSAKNCAGTHIHFQKGSVIDQLNLLTALDPALALLNSSPYYCSEAGDSSSRARAYRTKCGQEFQQFCELWPYAGSLQEWTDRVDQAYNHFKDLASSRGVSAAKVDELFEAENTVLNPVRLRRCQPTVEWRAPDAALPSEVIQLAVDVGELVSQTGEKPLAHGHHGVYSDRIGVPEFPSLRELSQEAIHSGLESTAVVTYLRKMGFDPSEYDPIAPEFSGPPVLGELSARKIRLQQASKLRQDIKAIAV
ncbi:MULTISPECIES: glutamate--cysteine ligase [unclassified Haloarcula]|uniref:glutamate--cysteine ligase n=1 Tax=unclassified Haloarcula TaxID=2624677 RepID=UPI00300F6F1E